MISDKIFDNFPDAFDYCREVDRPENMLIKDVIGWGLYKLFPSGRADLLRRIKYPEKLAQLDKHNSRRG